MRLSKTKYTLKKIVVIITIENPQKLDFPVKITFFAKNGIFTGKSHFRGFSCVMICTKLFYIYFVFERRMFLKKLEFYLNFEDLGFLTNVGFSIEICGG